MNIQTFAAESKMAHKLPWDDQWKKSGELSNYCDEHFDKLLSEIFDLKSTEEQDDALMCLVYHTKWSDSRFPEKINRRKILATFINHLRWPRRKATVPITEYESLYKEGVSILQTAVTKNVEPEHIDHYADWNKRLAQEYERIRKDPRWSEKLNDTDHLIS